MDIRKWFSRIQPMPLRKAGVNEIPTTKRPPPPPAQRRVAAELTEIERLHTAATADCAGSPEMIAGYMQAAATLRLAEEVRDLREVLQSGEAGITVSLESETVRD